jgi:hypothetical protein
MKSITSSEDTDTSQLHPILYTKVSEFHLYLEDRLVY